jgi:Ger(x)C family germination protein
MKKLLCCLLAALFICASCSMGEEIDTLGIVVGAAFDKPVNPGDINMTACILRVSGSGGGSSVGTGASSGGAKEYMVVNSEAPSFYEAQSRLMLKVERRPFWGHNNIIIAARDVNLKPIIEAFYNGYEKRGSEFVVIAKDNAAAALNSANFMGNVGAVSVSEVLTMTGQNGYITDVNVHELFSKMNARSRAAYVPYGQTANGNFDFLGMCVLRDYVFLSPLSGDETIGAMIVLGDYKSGGISVPLTGAVAGAELLETSCSVGCSKDKVFDIRVKASYSVQDVNGETDENNDEVAGRVDDRIKMMIESAIQKSKDLNADFMGFSDDYFKKYACDMPGGLAGATFNVTVDGKLMFKGIEY